MEHAIFLEKPIRGSPRRHFQAQEDLSELRLPSAPSNTASSASSELSHSPPSLECEDPLTSPLDLSAAHHRDSALHDTVPMAAT